MTLPPTDVDALVVGAGVIGASVAYHLALRGQRAVVLEALEAPAMGSTGRSFACVRAQWADPLNIEISARSIEVYRHFEDVAGHGVGYDPIGYLLLVVEDDWPAHLEAVALQREHGIPVEALDPLQATRLSDFDPTGLGGAAWCPTDGVVDPHLATTGFLAAAKARGVQVVYQAPVSAITQQAGDLWQLATPKGTWRAPVVVNAAGGWAGEIAALAGLDVPVGHSRRMVFAGALQPGRRKLPMTIDLATGTFLRSEGDRVLFGRANPDEPDGWNTALDWGWLEPVMEDAAERFPWLAELPLDRAASWAGTYEMTADHRPFIGRMPGAEGWVNACGFSGHGIMQAPMTGHLVAEEVVDGKAHTLDIGPLRLERLDDDRLHATALTF